MEVFSSLRPAHVVSQQSGEGSQDATSAVEFRRDRKASSFIQDNSDLIHHRIGHTWQILPDIFKKGR